VEVKLHAFLTSALNEYERSVSRPARLTPRVRNPGIPWIQGCVGPRAGLDEVATATAREKEPRSSSPYWLSYPRSVWWWEVDMNYFGRYLLLANIGMMII